MKEVISEFGNGILAAFVVIAIIVMCFGLFRGQLKEGLVSFDEKVYGTDFVGYV